MLLCHLIWMPHGLVTLILVVFVRILGHKNDEKWISTAKGVNADELKMPSAPPVLESNVI